MNQSQLLTRRRLLTAAGAGGLALATSPLRADGSVDFHVAGGPSVRPLTDAFPQKTGMVLQRVSPPWLETPFDAFDKGVFTPNDKHFVSWHWASFQMQPDLETYRLKIIGHVEKELSISIKELLNDYPRIELAAVSQCAGNSRMYMEPRIAGAQWAKGSLSNAKWTGVPLKAILDKAGVKAGALQVRFGGADDPVVPDAPRFLKTIDIDHARDGEVMVAFAMNDEQLPLLNGFPIKMVVPGWCAVYWIKQLTDIEVLSKPDDTYWTARGYRYPDTPNHTVKPDEKPGKDFKLISVTRNHPRSFITNHLPGSQVRAGEGVELRGIAFGGDCGVKQVDLSLDGGRTWKPTELGRDEGKYSFRQWRTHVALTKRGPQTLMVRCTNANNEAQPANPVWNPGGYMFNTIETTQVTII